MINLITGVPGSGKSLYAMSIMKAEIEKGRPIYVHGISDLKIPHVLVVCNSPSCEVCPVAPLSPEPPELIEVHDEKESFATKINEDREEIYQRKLKKYDSDFSEYSNLLKADEWHIWAPDGALIFFDEVQNVYRPRSSSSAVPPSVSAFETHRHRGLDFFLVTQSPLLFDGNIRRLTGRHIHLRVNWAGRFQYEWPECKDSLASTSGSVKSRYKLDKSVFDLYKSASLHTKQNRKTPAAFYWFFVIISIIAVLVFKMSGRYQQLINPNGVIVEKDNNVSSVVSGINPVSVDLNSKPVYSSKSSNYNEFGSPSNIDFSEISKPKDFPRLAACISNADLTRCSCYTQQGTAFDAELSLCFNFIKNRNFNPYYLPDPNFYKLQNIDKKEN